MHVFPNGKRYIGITSRKPETRWAIGYSHNKFMINAIKKYKWENVLHEILHEKLTESQAKNLEISLISKYQSNNRQYGYNITAGGEGSLGRIASEETRNKISVSLKGKAAWNKGKHHSIESRRKISKSKTGEKIGALSEEHKRKLSESKKGENNPNYNKPMLETTKQKLLESIEKPIIQLTKIGEIVNTFKSAREAERNTNIGHENISRCCNGKRKTAGGYKWEFKNEVK